jgi:predicted amidophosphoribosyltransferase
MAGGILQGLAELFFPGSCVLCGGETAAAPCESVTASRHLCASCLENLHPLSGFCCPVCSLPFAGTGIPHPCPSCQKKSPPFLRAVAWGSFGGTLREAIHAVKYRRELVARGVLGDLFLEACEGEWGRGEGFEAVVPVPCHKSALAERGFSLPAMLAERAASRWKVALNLRALEKTREGEKMAGLGLAQRRAAVRGLYRAREKLEGRVLLVDDVLTSLSTVKACALALRRAGAREVCVAALARAEVDPSGK